MGVWGAVTSWRRRLEERRRSPRHPSGHWRRHWSSGLMALPLRMPPPRPRCQTISCPRTCVYRRHSLTDMTRRVHLPPTSILPLATAEGPRRRDGVVRDFGANFTERRQPRARPEYKNDGRRASSATPMESALSPAQFPTSSPIVGLSWSARKLPLTIT